MLTFGVGCVNLCFGFGFLFRMCLGWVYIGIAFYASGLNVFVACFDVVWYEVFGLWLVWVCGVYGFVNFCEFGYFSFLVVFLC